MLYDHDQVAPYTTNLNEITYTTSTNYIGRCKPKYQMIESSLLNSSHLGTHFNIKRPILISFSSFNIETLCNHTQKKRHDGQPISCFVVSHTISKTNSKKCLINKNNNNKCEWTLFNSCDELPDSPYD